MSRISSLTRKRAREEEIEAAEKAKRDREWQKNFEVRYLHSRHNQYVLPHSV